MTSIEAVRALVERGNGCGAIWREYWEGHDEVSDGDGRLPRAFLHNTVILRDEGGQAGLFWSINGTRFDPLATDLLATDWKWSPT